MFQQPSGKSDKNKKPVGHAGSNVIFENKDDSCNPLLSNQLHNEDMYIETKSGLNLI